MPIAAASRRRKAKQTKKNKPNQHSSPALQLQGPSLSENHSKMEEAPFNGTLQDTHKVVVVVEEESLSEDNKEVVVEAPDTTVVSESEHVSESVADCVLEPNLNVSSPNEDTVVLELEQEKKDEDFLPVVVPNHEVEETELPHSEDNNNEFSSVSGNEVLLRETGVVETIKDMIVVAEEEDKDVFVFSNVVTEQPNPNEINHGSSLPLTDVVSREALEISDAKSDENVKVSPPKGIEKSLVISTNEKVGDVQELSSYESAKESFQPSQNISDAESNSAIEQGKIEEPRSFENPIIVPLTQRQHTSWKSCCGLFEILRHGDR